MDIMIDAKDLVGLDFQDDKKVLECLRIIHEANPRIYFELPGGNSLIVLQQQLDDLALKLNEKGITFSVVKVVSAGDPEVRDFVRERRTAYIRGRYPKGEQGR